MYTASSFRKCCHKTPESGFWKGYREHSAFLHPANSNFSYNIKRKIYTFRAVHTTMIVMCWSLFQAWGCSSEHCRHLPCCHLVRRWAMIEWITKDVSESGEWCAQRTSYLSPRVRLDRDLNEDQQPPRTGIGWNIQAAQKDRWVLSFDICAKIWYHVIDLWHLVPLLHGK